MARKNKTEKPKKIYELLRNKGETVANPGKEIIFEKRKFSMNEDVFIQGIGSVVQGYYKGSFVLVRVPVKNIEKETERKLETYECLTPKAQLSRLYLMPEENVVRPDEKSKGQVTPKIKRKTKQ